MKNYKTIICVAAAVCLLGTAAFLRLPYFIIIMHRWMNRRKPLRRLPKW